MYLSETFSYCYIKLKAKKVDKIILYTGFGKEDVNRLAGKLDMVPV